jgi:hypothetical protein
VSAVRGNDGRVKNKETASYDLTGSFQGYGSRPLLVSVAKTQRLYATPDPRYESRVTHGYSLLCTLCLSAVPHAGPLPLKSEMINFIAEHITERIAAMRKEEILGEAAIIHQKTEIIRGISQHRK